MQWRGWFKFAQTSDLHRRLLPSKYVCTKQYSLHYFLSVILSTELHSLIVLETSDIYLTILLTVVGHQFLCRYFVRYYLSVEGQQIACLAFNLRICNDDKCP